MQQNRASTFYASLHALYTTWRAAGFNGDAIFYYLGQEMVGFPQEKMSIYT